MERKGPSNNTHLVLVPMVDPALYPTSRCPLKRQGCPSPSERLNRYHDVVWSFVRSHVPNHCCDAPSDAIRQSQIQPCPSLVQSLNKSNALSHLSMGLCTKVNPVRQLPNGTQRNRLRSYCHCRTCWCFRRRSRVSRKPSLSSILG